MITWSDDVTTWPPPSHRTVWNAWTYKNTFRSLSWRSEPSFFISVCFLLCFLRQNGHNSLKPVLHEPLSDAVFFLAPVFTRVSCQLTDAGGKSAQEADAEWSTAVFSHVVNIRAGSGSTSTPYIWYFPGRFETIPLFFLRNTIPVCRREFKLFTNNNACINYSAKKLLHWLYQMQRDFELRIY